MAIRFPDSDAAITVDSSTTFVYQLVERSSADGLTEPHPRVRQTNCVVSPQFVHENDGWSAVTAGLDPGTDRRRRVDLFGTKGVDAVSLDEIARHVGVRKQTVLYWFESKDDLVDGVLESVAAQLIVVIDAAARSATADPLEKIDAVVRAVFRPSVRRPALLGVVREMNRLSPAHADRLHERISPLIERAVRYLGDDMDRQPATAGSIRA